MGVRSPIRKPLRGKQTRQLVVLLEELDMIIVTTAAPLNEIPADGLNEIPADGWKYEKAVIDLVGEFIKSLPNGQR
jgi:hypothetical protein